MKTNNNNKGLVIILVVVALVGAVVATWAINSVSTPWKDNAEFLQVFSDEVREEQSEYLASVEYGKGLLLAQRNEEAYLEATQIVSDSTNFYNALEDFQDKYEEDLTSEQAEFVESWKSTVGYMSDGWARFEHNVNTGNTQDTYEMVKSIRDSYSQLGHVTKFIEEYSADGE